jgi:hypothetical protein
VLSACYLSISERYLSFPPAPVTAPATALPLLCHLTYPVLNTALLFQAMQQSEVLKRARIVYVDIAVQDVVAPKSKLLKKAAELVMPELGFCPAVTHRIHGTAMCDSCCPLCLPDVYVLSSLFELKIVGLSWRQVVQDMSALRRKALSTWSQSKQSVAASQNTQARGSMTSAVAQCDCGVLWLLWLPWHAWSSRRQGRQ